MEENNKNKSAMGIAGFVLGIISTLSTLFWYITLPTGVLAIILGAKSAKKTGNKLGIVGLSIFAFIYISLIMIITLNNL